MLCIPVTIVSYLLQVIKYSIQRMQHIEIVTGYGTTFPVTHSRQQFTTCHHRQRTTSRYKRATMPVMGPCLRLLSSELPTVCPFIIIFFIFRIIIARSHHSKVVRAVDWQSRGYQFEFHSLLYKVLLVRKALDNHLIKSSGLDKNRSSVCCFSYLP